MNFVIVDNAKTGLRPIRRPLPDEKPLSWAYPAPLGVFKTRSPVSLIQVHYTKVFRVTLVTRGFLALGFFLKPSLGS